MKRNAKHTATISLGVMGAGFLATFPIAGTPYGVVLQSGFEAGLAGGLADWFAVTALFRHPLGLPIPHTALLPKNREKVTNALVNAIQTNLLHKESIIEKLQGAKIAERLLVALRDRLQTEEVAAWIASAAESLIRQIDPAAAADAIAPAVRNVIRDIDEAHWIDKAAKAAVERKYEERAFDFALLQAEKFVVREDTRARMGAMAAGAIGNLQVGGLMGFAVNAFAGFMSEERLGAMIQEFLLATLSDMRLDTHPYRQAALQSIRETLLGLHENRKAVDEVSAWKHRIAESPALETALAEWLAKVQIWAVEKAADPQFIEERVLPFLRNALDRTLEHPDAVDKLDGMLRRQIAQLVENNHGAIGKLVKENADKLDTESLIAMMEEHIGKDLQWIRVNGAICGFAIGLVLGVIQLLV
ncbi:DUF445 domain-containing protein [Paenibacillus alkalitolerans]|uniref:DUF445 domain-containing protein n=1 Tax=Paenibacillus alkalitolerans TaxID=2799335 RepID=UPI0018F75C6A|nr:DUF445 domain-containing protein [Paenibacillus alkalitolerans]